LMLLQPHLHFIVQSQSWPLLLILFLFHTLNSFLSNQSGCKNCPHFLQAVDSWKCTRKQFRLYKCPQDIVSTSM
jgi:hypothetical protein